MKRITLSIDERGLIHRICADEKVDVRIADPNAPTDRGYSWGSLLVGREHVDEEIEGWPVGDKVICLRAIECDLDDSRWAERRLPSPHQPEPTASAPAVGPVPVEQGRMWPSLFQQCAK
jgi:hypothetical protein